MKMKKQKQFVLFGMMLVMLTTVSLSGCTNAVDKSKFIGTWTTSGEGTWTFTNDDKVTVTNQVGDISLSGTYTWAVAAEKITFTSEAGGSLGITLDYRFTGANPNQLILTNSQGGSVTLTKA